MPEIKAVLFVHPAPGVSAIVCPSTRDIGCWQFTVIWQNQFPCEHFTFGKFEEAMVEALQRGFQALQVRL
jgi:hypothetical protein